MRHSNKWFQIRYDLYRHVRARVQQRLGKESSELKKYRQALDREISKPWKFCHPDQLLKAILKSRIVLMADFHALKQSQKTHLRILKKLPSKKNVVLAIECIGSHHQKEIDLFQTGKISEKEFLKSVDWENSWGFPWENYSPLFEWARYHKVRIYGLNQKERAGIGMRKRDKFAAKKIKEIIDSSPNSQVFVVYGDLHLAQKHLPLDLKRWENSIVRVFQNPEKIYFDVLRKKRRDETEVVRLDSQTFCVLNVPPWVKWQSYLMFLEQTYDSSLEEVIDYTDHVISYARLITKELKLEAPLSDFSVYTVNDSHFWKRVSSETTQKELTWVARLIDEDQSFFLPSSSIGFLARCSVNQGASLAMEYLLCRASGLEENLLQVSDYFLQWIWIKAWVYFGSKLVNPRRKTATLIDIRTRLTTRKGLLEREPLQLALSHKIFELVKVTGSVKRTKRLKPRSKQSYIIAAELLGGMMGEKIFQAYQTKELTAREIRERMATPMNSKKFEESYFDFVGFLEKIPISFKSKEERI